MVVRHLDDNEDYGWSSGVTYVVLIRGFCETVAKIKCGPRVVFRTFKLKGLHILVFCKP